MKYPGIERATIEMAYDNGCINRDRSEESLVLDLVSWMRDVETEHGMRPETLQACDEWLTSLSVGELRLLCAGDESEQAVILAKVPAVQAVPVELLLTWIFEEVL